MPDIKGDYRCFTYGMDATGLAYFPQLGKNVVYSSRVANTKTVSKELVPAVYYDKKIYVVDKKKKKMYLLRGEEEKQYIDIPEKDKKIVYVNPLSFEIYEPKSVKNTPDNPIRLGYVTSKSVYSKTRKD